MRQFTVTKGVLGYVVQIGCQFAGFTNKEDLIAAIAEYIKDPEGMETKLYRTLPTPSYTGESLSLAPSYAEGTLPKSQICEQHSVRTGTTGGGGRL